MKKRVIIFFITNLIYVASIFGGYLFNPKVTLLIGFILSFIGLRYCKISKKDSHLFFNKAFFNLQIYFLSLLVLSVLETLHIYFLERNNSTNIYSIVIILLCILTLSCRILVFWYFLKVLYDIYYFVINLKTFKVK